MGNTSAIIIRVANAVHPHACGEHFGVYSLTLCFRFTPTPVGNTCARLNGHPAERFTPTPVGNTSLHWLGRHPLAVHPHACGEHFSAWIRRIHYGSPPRLWGTPGCGHQGCHPVRFTPTPVGNTWSTTNRPSRTVHPHACGEHVAISGEHLRRHPVHPHACGEHPYFNLYP